MHEQLNGFGRLVLPVVQSFNWKLGFPKASVHGLISILKNDVEFNHSRPPVMKPYSESLHSGGAIKSRSSIRVLHLFSSLALPNEVILLLIISMIAF